VVVDSFHVAQGRDILVMGFDCVTKILVKLKAGNFKKRASLSYWKRSVFSR
jgi:hypothetical protein